MRTLRRPLFLFLLMLCTAPLLMAPSGKIQGCAGYYTYTDCQAGQTQECYTGPAVTKGKGACKPGTQTCGTEGTWGSCEGEVTPAQGAKEECNGKDDDCNGNIDEGLTAPPCEQQTGVCKGAVKRCDGANGWVACAAPEYVKVGPSYVAEEGAAHCDGKDNDCDGQIDEECVCTAGQTQPCGNDQGTCTKGTQTCSNAGAWGDCTGGTGPVKETCDNQDNDCNGQVDDGTELCPQGQSCKAGKCESETTGPKLLFKGTFVGASGHSTVGETEISQDGTKETVTLKADFKTDSGPELRVYLVADEKGGATNDNFIDIGKLKSISGEQTYELPAGKSTKDYKSVVIWCKPFGVNFGYATLVAP